MTLFHHIIYYLYPNPQTNHLIVILYSRFTFWSGVDLFFCISGFVIMLSFLNLISKNSTQISNPFKISVLFWARRLIRLMPAAIFWMCIYLLLTAKYNFLGAFGQFEQNVKDMTAALFQYANLYGLNCWGPLSNVSCGPNGIYWSLSLEEQFYFVFPILFFIFRKNLAYPLAVLFFVQFFKQRPEWSLFWAFRFDSIILGILIASLTKNRLHKLIEPKFLIQNVYISNAFVTLCVFLMAYLSAAQNKMIFNVGFIALICGVLVWLASYEKNYINFEIKYLKNVMSWFGSRSYSIYLSHIVAFRLSYEFLYQFSDVGYKITENSFMPLLLTSVVLVFIFSELSYRFIEVPCKKWAQVQVARL